MFHSFNKNYLLSTVFGVSFLYAVQAHASGKVELEDKGRITPPIKKNAQSTKDTVNVTESEWAFFSLFCSRYNSNYDQPMSSQEAQDHLKKLFDYFCPYAKVTRPDKNFINTKDGANLIRYFYNGICISYDAYREAKDRLTISQGKWEKFQSNEYPLYDFLSYAITYITEVKDLTLKLDQVSPSTENLAFLREVDEPTTFQKTGLEDKDANNHDKIVKLFSQALNLYEMHFIKSTQILKNFTKKVFMFLDLQLNSSSNIGLISISGKHTKTPFPFFYLRDSSSELTLIPIPVDYKDKTIFRTVPHGKESKTPLLIVDKGEIVTSPGVLIQTSVVLPMLFQNTFIKDIPTLRIKWREGANGKPPYLFSQQRTIVLGDQIKDKMEMLSEEKFTNEVFNFQEQTNHLREVFNINEEMKTLTEMRTESMLAKFQYPPVRNGLNQIQALTPKNFVKKCVESMVPHVAPPPELFKILKDYLGDNLYDPKYKEFIPLPEANTLEEKLFQLDYIEECYKKSLKLLKEDQSTSLVSQKDEISSEKEEKCMPQDVVLSYKETIEDLKKEILKSYEFKESYESLVRQEQEAVSKKVIEDSRNDAPSKKKKGKSSKHYPKSQKIPEVRTTSNSPKEESLHTNEKMEQHLEDLKNSTRTKFTKVRKLLNMARKLKESSDTSSHINQVGNHSIIHNEEGTLTFAKKHGHDNSSYGAKHMLNFVQGILHGLNHIEEE